MHAVVINNREGLVQGQLQPDPRFAAVKGGVPLNRCVTLLPGANLVPEDDLKSLLENKAFAANFTVTIPKSPAPEQNPEKVGKPILELLMVDGKDGKKTPLQVEEKHPLAKLKDEIALKLIEETLVPSVLRGWLNEDPRPGIRLELTKRLAELDGQPEGGPAAAGR